MANTAMVTNELFLSSPGACVGFLWVFCFPSTLQRHATDNSKLPVSVNVYEWLFIC